MTNVDAVKQHRERIATFFAVSDVNPISSDDLLHMMMDLADSQLKTFTSEVLSNIPIFNVQLNY